jgi:3'(2'), 5'-bisphosphate nucleotidase
MMLKELLLLACELALGAGKEILKVYETDFNVDVKDDNSPLTLADENSHRLILSGLSQTGYPVMSEEGLETEYEVRKQWTRYWCVDPLDGTREFVKKNGEFTVNIALIENNSPILGVIYVPVQDLLYAAVDHELYRIEKASGKDLAQDGDLDRFRIMPAKPKKSGTRLRVLASRSHLSRETRAYLAELENTFPEMEFFSAGSALKFGLLAEGKADLYPRFSPCMEWDTAAGHALLKTAGKNIFLYPSGKELSYNKKNLVNDWFIAR